MDKKKRKIQPLCFSKGDDRQDDQQTANDPDDDELDALLAESVTRPPNHTGQLVTQNVAHERRRRAR
ncbi:hypothetical protein MRB53_040127 [Persea americana]|nr:hypothetical protein MRB53_040127 [Persea americana]